MPFPKATRNYSSVLRAAGFLTREAGRLNGMKVINKTGSAISADKLVAISGYDVTSKLPKIVLADADAADLATDVFVALAAISDGKAGNVFKGGTSAATLNTNSVTTVGDPLFLDTVAGGFTATAPVAPNARTQVVGYAMVKSATVGQIKWDIKPPSKLGTQDVTGGAAFTTVPGDAAIPLSSGISYLTKGSAAAITVAAPGANGIGLRLTITSGSAFAHVVTFTGTTLQAGLAAAKLTWTAAAFPGSSITVIGATASQWNVESFNLGAFA